MNTFVSCKSANLDRQANSSDLVNGSYLRVVYRYSEGFETDAVFEKVIFCGADTRETTADDIANRIASEETKEALATDEVDEILVNPFSTKAAVSMIFKKEKQTIATSIISIHHD